MLWKEHPHSVDSGEHTEGSNGQKKTKRGREKWSGMKCFKRTGKGPNIITKILAFTTG